MKYLITLITPICLVFTSYAQSLQLDKNGSTMEIQGTSSVHDWESKVENFNATAKLQENQITDIEFTAVVKSIKSGKSGMDKNIYKALKEDNFPEIKFVADQLSISDTNLTGSGQLTIAGKTQNVSIQATVSQESKLKVSGSLKLKMTDYDITPPTAVFGTIKTGDEVTIQFNFTLNKN